MKVLSARHAKEEEEDVRRPYNTDGDACVQVIGEKEGDPHECGDGEHDAEFFHRRHTAPPLAHKEQRCAVDARRLQPVREAAGAARKAVRGEQDEGNGRENGEKRSKNAESEAEKSEDGEKDFFQDHGVVFLSMK